MNEVEWLASTQAEAMLGLVREGASDRKLRLFACACCRRLGVGKVVEVCERYADGLAGEDELRALRWIAGRGAGVVAHNDSRFRLNWNTAWVVKAATAANAWRAALETARATADKFREAQCAILRELFGNPFRPVEVRRDWLAWEGGVVGRVAQEIDEERAFDRLGVLADALEDAGCAEERLLAHFREPEGHLLGCWGLDLILGRP